MKKFQYSISPQIFLQFPEYIRGVIIIKNVKNGYLSESLSNLLNDTITSFRNNCTKSEDIMKIESISAWRLAFKKLGFNSDTRPSVDSLLRRCINNPDGLKPISFLVDIGNINSIKYCLPIGVHEIYDDTSKVELTVSDGSETFIDFGKEYIEHPNKGEFILIDGLSVLTRRWIWRQGKKSIITLDTKNIYINVDCLNHSKESVYIICEKIAQMVTEYCGGKSDIYLLKKDSPSMEVEM